MLIYHCFVTHHTTTQQENTDIKYVFQSYSIKKNILIQFLIQKKLIVVGLFLLLAGILLNQASFAPRILMPSPVSDLNLGNNAFSLLPRCS